MDDDLVSQRWDAQYADGKYSDVLSIAFTDRIVDTLVGESAEDIAWPGCGDGLYVGCGNGRNFVAIADSRLGIRGIDVSPVAIRQLSERRPDLAGRLSCMDFADCPERPLLDYIVSIQAFQHGTGAQVRGYFEKVSRMLRPGGLFFLRVNSASTDVCFDHEVVERDDTGGFTVLYHDGPKRGLNVHFYSRRELDALCADFEYVAAPCEQVTERDGPKTGTWLQWETVMRKR